MTSRRHAISAKCNNQDGGLAAAAKLAVGQVSTAFRSTTGDGYYVVKTLQKTAMAA